MAFVCERCEVGFKSKRNLIGHLQKIKTCEAKSEISPSCDVLLQRLEKPQNPNPYICNRCEKKFNTQSAMYKHLKKCTQGQQSNPVATTIDVQALKEQLKIEILKELQTTTPQTVINNTTTNITIQNTQVVLHNFGEENIEHLSDEFLYDCLQNPQRGISTLIETIHYNVDYPENHNICCKSLKQNLFEKYQNSVWRMCDASNTLDELIRKGYRILDTYFTNNVQSEPDFFDDEARVQRFERFRFLCDKNSTEYHAVKRDLRILVKDMTMYVLASPENGIGE